MYNHSVWSMRGGKITFYQLKKQENSMTVALSDKENSRNQQIRKNEASLNVFNDVV